MGMSLSSIPRLKHHATCCHMKAIDSTYVPLTTYRLPSTYLTHSLHQNQARRRAPEHTITLLSALIPLVNPHPASRLRSPRYLQPASAKLSMIIAMGFLRLHRQPALALNASPTSRTPQKTLTTAAAQTKGTFKHPIPPAASRQHK